mgnify:CR=1 FL=1
MPRRSMIAVLVALTTPGRCHAAQVGAAKCAPDNAGLKLPAGFCASIFRRLAGARRAPLGRRAKRRRVRFDAGRRWRRESCAPSKSERSGRRAQACSQRASRRARSRCSRGTSTTEALPSSATKEPRSSTTAAPRSVAILAISAQGRRAGHRAARPRHDRQPASQAHPATERETSPSHARLSSLYANVGSPTNSCQERKDRASASPGKRIRATGLDTRAGRLEVHRCAKEKPNAGDGRAALRARNSATRSESPSVRSTASCGRRSTAATTSAARGGNWPFDAKYNSENPAEELMQVNQGDDYGWPYCYYSVEEHHLVLAPEYGGDGKKLGHCAQKRDRSRRSLATGRRTRCSSTRERILPARYQERRVHRVPRILESRAGAAGTDSTWCSNRLPTARSQRGAFEVFADGFAPSVDTGRATGAADAIVRPDSRRDQMARCT